MNRLQRFRQRLRDMRAQKDHSLKAERVAEEMNELPPGTKHYLLAAFDLTDGTARAAFEALGAGSHRFKSAIEEQYNQALRAIAIEPLPASSDISDNDAPGVKPTLFKAKPDVSTLFKSMYEFNRARPDGPLLGASVVAVVATFDYGVAARALRAMDVDRNALAESARQIVDNWSGPAQPH